MKTSCISPPLFDPLSYLNTSREYLHVGHHNMKRRTNTSTNDAIKRRPLKRNKISENLLGSTLVYVKLLLLWLVVLVADYFLEFRFEYLWPFWLLVRSIYDSFKYQGLAFSVLFICIALTSDMICFLFIPVHWLFFAASTYVWVQYVWHTEKGICLPTVFLWLLFVYIEAAVRLRDYKLHVDLKNLPFHLDLCRPFAAHCIGYPVVTLGFGFKSYVGYRMRQRRQKEIQKENETYYSFLREALPEGVARDNAFNPSPSPKPGLEDRILKGDIPGVGIQVEEKVNRSPDKQLLPAESSPIPRKNGSASKVSANGDVELSCMERENGLGDAGAETKPSKANSKSISEGKELAGRGGAGRKSKEENKSSDPLIMMMKLDAEVKKFKCDLHLSRNRENELREKIVHYMSSERCIKSEVSTLLVEKSTLEARIDSLISSRASEKQTLHALEKKFAEEKKQRIECQQKLDAERRHKKEVNAERVAAAAQQSVNSGTIAKMENEMCSLRDELAKAERRAELVEEEMKALKKNNASGEVEKLKIALNAAQDQQMALEQTLSSETKVKMDLLSALGAAKRQLQINETMLMSKDRELLVMKSNVAEMLAVMPTSNNISSFGGLSGISAAPGGFPATTRSAASSGSFYPNSLDLSSEVSMSDLPAGVELSKLAGLGLADLENKLNNYEKNASTMNGSSLYTSTMTYSQTNGNHNDA